MQPLLDLKVSQRSRQRQKAGEWWANFFSEQMFSTLICVSFLSWSILNLKEKSWRVSIPFLSHVVNKHTGLEDPLFSKYGMETFKQGNTENWYVQNPFQLWILSMYWEHIFGKTKVILSCLFLLEAHGLELYYRPIRIKYHGNTYIKYDKSPGQMLWQMRKHCWAHK